MVRTPAELVHTLRLLRRRPAFAAFVIVTLALGIGGATAMFSVLDGVLLKPLPYAAADRLMTVWQTFPHWQRDPTLASDWDRIGLSWEDLQATRSARSFEQVEAYYSRAATIVRPGLRPEQMPVAKASAGLMPLLGVRPLLGRWLTQEEEGAGATRVAVLSYEEWVTAWNANAGVIGRVVRVGGDPYEVVGVLPRGFDLRALHPRADRLPPRLWTPIGTDENDLRAFSQNYEGLARLAPGVSPQTAASELYPLMRGKRAEGEYGVRVLPRLDAETVATRPALMLLAIAVAVLLLLTCANVGALLLADGAARESELATRAALGAGPGRLLRQLLLETVTLALIAAVFAVAVAHYGTRALLSLAPTNLPRAAEVGIDLRVLGFALLIGTLCTLAIGLAPALLARGFALRLNRQSARVTGSARFEYLLISAQVTLSMLLLASAALLARSLGEQRRFDSGFNSDGLLAVRVRTGSFPDESALHASVEEALRRTRALPSVVDATVATAMPYRERGNMWSIDLDSVRKLSVRSPSAIRITVMPGYFQTMGIPVPEGRAFNTGGETERVAVVNRAFVQRFWPGQPVIGRAFRTPAGVFTIVGVAGDTRMEGLEIAPEATFYLPYAFSTTSRITFLVRTRGDAMALAGPVTDMLARLDPELAVVETNTVPGLIHESLADERYRTMLLTAFAAMATLLAAIGLAGTTQRALARRRRELCIRLSVGATPADATAELLGRSAVAVAIGISAGVLGALMVGGVLRGYLHGVELTDPAALGMGIAAMLLATTVALAGPARRLWQTDIAQTLRDP